MTLGTTTVTKTTTGPIVLGMMWRRMICQSLKPKAWAALTNSRRFKASVWPRTIRAISSHSTAPMTRKIRMKLRPKKTTRTTTRKTKGSE
ncbi:hypothetical protein D3C87_1743840 [compost metagenome]